MKIAENDARLFAESGGFSFGATEKEPVLRDATDQVREGAEPDFEAMTHALVATYFNAGPTAFAELVEEHRGQLRVACAVCERLGRIVEIGLRMGVAEEDGACAMQLGSLHCTGDIVEQDYEQAAECYEHAAELGFEQAIINLGRLYEYGRIGAPDQDKAYLYYSFAAAVHGSSEALWKMGDLFSKGVDARANRKAAFTLWQRSLDAATDVENEAQAALRIAQVMIDQDECERMGIDPDPLEALRLFQIAEIGLRTSIGKGLDQYGDRLRAAIEGQDAARKALRA